MPPHSIILRNPWRPPEPHLVHFRLSPLIASFEFQRYLCIAMVWLWADAVISELKTENTEKTSDNACLMMTFVCSLVSQLALVAAFSKSDDGKGAVGMAIERSIPFVGAAGYLLFELSKNATLVADTQMHIVVAAYVVVAAVSAWRVAARVGYGMRSVNTVGAVPQWVCVVGSLSLLLSEFIRRRETLGLSDATMTIQSKIAGVVIVKSFHTLALACFTLAPLMGQSRLLELKED